MTLKQLIEHGNTAMENSDWEAAHQFWKEVHEQSPDHEWAQVRLGITLLELNRLEEAEPFFLNDTEQHPDRAIAFIHLAKLAEKQGNWELATQRWEIVVKKFPKRKWAWQSYAVALKQIGDLGKSERCFLKDVEMSPGHKRSYMELIQIAIEKKKFKLAQCRIEQYSEMFPTHMTGKLTQYQQSIDNHIKSTYIKSYFNIQLSKDKKQQIKNRITVIPQFKCMYVAVPKVATSTIIRNLHYMVYEENQKFNEVIRYSMKGFIRPDSDLSGHFLKQVVSVLNSKDYFVFTFVRNPYSRILSAYLNKFQHRGKEGEGYRKRLGFEVYSVVGDIPFLDFLKRLRDYAPDDLNVHFAPQWYLLGLNKAMKYDFIGRLENMTTDLPYLLTQLSKDQRVKTLHQAPHATNASNKLQQYYGEEEQALVAEIYADDFQYLGYGYDLDII